MNMHSKSVTGELAGMALDLRLECLPPEAVTHAKRLVIDSLACIVGGYHSPTGIACRKVAHELGGPPQSTMIGERSRVSCRSAVFANEGMLRYLDYNDDIEIAIGPGDIVSTHPSGALPVAMAVSEMTGATGKQFLESMIAGYEVIGWLLESFKTSLEVRGFHHAAVLSFAGAAMAARLLGLSQEQLIQAMGIAGAMCLSLGILDAEGEEYVMTKNIVDGFSAERGLMAAMLARHGLTGPERIIEGSKGFAQTALGGADKFALTPRREHPFILETVTKYICAEATTHGHLTATQAIMRENRLEPQDVAGVTIRTNQRSVFHTGDPVKKYPRNKESADHSSYFLTAVTILDGGVSPKSYLPEKFADPRVRALIDKIQLVHGPEFDAKIPSAEVIIKTDRGVEFRQRVEPEELKGSPQRPMSDEDIRDKFLVCAEGLLTAAQVDAVIETCNRLETLDKFADVPPLLVLSAAR